MNERIVRKNRMSGFVVCGRASSSSVCGQVSSFVVSGFDVGQAPIPSPPSERSGLGGASTEIVFEVKNRHYRQRALPYMRKSPFIHDDELSRCPRQCRTTPTSSFSPRGLSGLRTSLTSVLSASSMRLTKTALQESSRPLAPLFDPDSSSAPRARRAL